MRLRRLHGEVFLRRSAAAPAEPLGPALSRATGDRHTFHGDGALRTVRFQNVPVWRAEDRPMLPIFPATSNRPWAQLSQQPVARPAGHLAACGNR